MKRIESSGPRRRRPAAAPPRDRVDGPRARQRAASGVDEDEEALRTSELVHRAQAGEGDALDALFRRYQPAVIDMARRRVGGRLKTKEEADDLAQTAFREAARDFPRYEYRGKRSLLGWLSQILQNKIRDKAEYYDADKRDVSRELALDAPRGGDGEAAGHDPRSPDLSVSRSVQRIEEFALLRSRLACLSELHRQAIELVFFEGLTLREAGRRMDGRSEDAVRMLVRRAAGRLRDMTHNELGN